MSFFLALAGVVNQQLGFSCVCVCVCVCVKETAPNGTTTVTLLHGSDFQLRNVPSLYRLQAWTAQIVTPSEHLQNNAT